MGLRIIWREVLHQMRGSTGTLAVYLGQWSDSLVFDVASYHIPLVPPRNRMNSKILQSCPQTQREIVSSYFLEHRAKLIDIAAYLDRVDRGTGSESDFRHEAFVEALKILLSDQPDRAKRILLLFSSKDPEIPQSAHGLKGATGAAPLENPTEL